MNPNQSARTTIPVLGARTPGLGRLRFYEARLADPALGDWVAIPGPAGEEPAQVVVTPQQVAAERLPRPLPAVTRRLSAEEIARVAELTAQARAALDRAIDVVRAGGLPVFLTGLRFTLDGSTALVSYRGDEEQMAVLASTLAGALGLPVHPEREGPLEPAAEHLFGGVGRLRIQEDDLDVIVAARFDTPGPEAFAPEGLPRIGSRVQTPDGPGILLSVSTRHWHATVRLDTGTEVTVPIADLTPVGG